MTHMDPPLCSAPLRQRGNAERAYFPVMLALNYLQTNFNNLKS